MISTVELVVVICQGLLQPRKSYVLATFGFHFSNIVLKQSNVATLVKSILRKCACIQLLFSLLTLSILLQSGVLNLLLVIYLQQKIKSTL